MLKVYNNLYLLSRPSGKMILLMLFPPPIHHNLLVSFNIDPKFRLSSLKIKYFWLQKLLEVWHKAVWKAEMLLSIQNISWVFLFFSLSLSLFLSYSSYLFTTIIRATHFINTSQCAFLSKVSTVSSHLKLCQLKLYNNNSHW